MLKLKMLILVLVTAASFMFLYKPAPALEILDSACKTGNAATANSPACQQNKANKGADVNPVVKTIKDAANLIGMLGGIIAVIVIIFSGIRFILSAGNPENQKVARSSLTGALIGLVIIVLAWSIVNVVLNLLS